MINAFVIHHGRLQQVTCDHPSDLASVSPVWVDLHSESDEERRWVEEAYKVKLPSRDEVTDIEASARYYEDDDGVLHIRTDFLLDDEEQSRNVPVAFVVVKDLLISVHDEDLPVFRLVRMRARIRPGSVRDAMDVLLDLYSTDAEYSADSLEGVYAALEEVSKRVLGKNLTDADAAKALESVAAQEDLNGRIRRNVMDTRRAVSFLMRARMLKDEQYQEGKQIMRDIESLDNHTAYLFDKINFLMDATIGFININQNKIIKIFSVAAVAFLPPTLIASIYGMNFQMMPELRWEVGYPFALGLMIVSAIAPFLYFRYRGWLD
ncbi:magnesium/cobalt transporter CorA [Pandoraea oxalativorans]|uniref:Magnesium transport protein CorA n=1 Tax=Pandoraea oxalativorans TaxID=573737 RepID=A0A0E3Y9Q6_9BURK|nr:magnesium/cobalt transporter CorA [Pandoraea oxalativorans]AKC68382.1 magnesium and cobalt transport protein CorA [Pandoraea oxalativorans]